MKKVSPVQKEVFTYFLNNYHYLTWLLLSNKEMPKTDNNLNEEIEKMVNTGITINDNLDDKNKMGLILAKVLLEITKNIHENKNAQKYAYYGWLTDFNVEDLANLLLEKNSLKDNFAYKKLEIIKQALKAFENIDEKYLIDMYGSRQIDKYYLGHNLIFLATKYANENSLNKDKDIDYFRNYNTLFPTDNLKSEFAIQKNYLRAMEKQNKTR